MLNKNWRGLIKVVEIGKISSDKILIWKEEHLYNMLHFEGEEYIMRVLFDGEAIPDVYYFGLDNRLDIIEDQNMEIVGQGEPCSNGYVRQTVDSSGQFELSQTTEGVWVAKTPVIQFSAIGGEWGPVRNLFMTNQEDNSGYLISSVKLTSQTKVLSGETIYVKMGLMLRDDETLMLC